MLFLLAITLSACAVDTPMDGAATQADAGYPQEPHVGAPAEGGRVPGAPPADGDRMVILTQTLRLEVDSTPDAIDAVRELADKHSAIVTNMRMANDDGWIYDSPASGDAALRGWVTVRVPTDGLAGLVADATELGKVVYQAETSDDVTQEHVDLSARLENLRAQEARLRELIGQAANVEETLAVEQEMWRVRGEIESLDAQVKYLERQAAMATVTIELTEAGAVVTNWGFGEALRTGIRTAAAVLAFVITFLIASSPLWLLGLAAAYVVRRVRRRSREQRDRTPTASSAIPQPSVSLATQTSAANAPVDAGHSPNVDEDTPSAPPDDPAGRP